MLELIVNILEKLGLALLGTFFQSTAATAQSAGVDSTALEYLAQLVASARSNTTLTTPEQEYAWVMAQAAAYFTSRGMDIAVSLLESLVKLAVHNLNVSSGAPVATVSSIATSAAS